VRLHFGRKRLRLRRFGSPPPLKIEEFSNPPGEVPNAHRARIRYCPGPGATQCTTYTQGGGGVSSHDMILYISSIQSSTCPTSSATAGTLAYASNCQRDQTDRPVFGFINFCPVHVSADPAALVSQLSTAVHEIFHAMGFGNSVLPQR
jgi:hypothetical protein